jgi:hypothetical protein
VPSCDADYDYASRPQAVKDAVAKVALTGHIGKPMLTLHGTLDSLLPIRTDSDVYDRMIANAGEGPSHRYYVIEHGNHVDGRYDLFPDRLRPMLPCYRTAFDALTKWVEDGTAPPPSQFVADTHKGDIVNECGLASSAAVPAPGGSTPAGGKRLKPRVRVAVSPRRDRRAPYRFRTSGRLLLPAGVTRAEACGNGTVTVVARSRGRSVASKQARLGARCKFSTRIAFRARPRPYVRRRVLVRARFNGNRALLPARTWARAGAG